MIKRNIYKLIKVNKYNMDVLSQLVLEAKKTDINKLDLRDKKILFTLSQNVRTPLTKIAKFSALSRDSVKYRLNKYEKQGILKRSRTLVNVSKLGYDSYHIFFRLNNPSKESKKEMIKKISEMPFVRSILKFFGSFDLEIAVIAKSLYEFDSHLGEIINVTKNSIQDYEIIIITENYRSSAFPNNFLEGIRKDIKSYKSERPKKDEYKPDNKDFEIIKVIRDDAQMPLISIASKVKISPDAVSYRLKKLQENIIIAFVPVINFQAIGYNIHALLLNINGLDKEKEKKLSEFFRYDKNVLWAVKTVGRYNVLAYLCSKNEIELQQSIGKLRSLFPEQINRYESLLALEQYKYTYVPDCIFEK